MAQPSVDIVESQSINKTYMPYHLDEGIAHRAAIGLIVLATDETIEHEWRRLLNLDGVSFFVSRIPSARIVTPEALRATEADITRATHILPNTRLDVVAYGCTSASVFIGEETVARRICEARPGVHCTTPITAAKAAFQALGLSRIALFTPYSEEINQAMRRHLETAGVQVPVRGSFNNKNDTEVARIAPAAIREAVLELGRESAVEGVFVSCTNLRIAALIDELEAQLDKPVTSSCHATAWHALRLAGVTDPLPGQGRLFQC